MSHTHQLMPIIIEMANTTGHLVEPTKLLESIRSFENPIEALSGWDNNNDIFSALQQDIGNTSLHPMQIAVNSPEGEQLIGLVRWFIEHLHTWQDEKDPKRHELTALFVIAQQYGFDQELWDAIPNSIAQNQSLLDGLSNMLSHFRTDFMAQSGMREPIWERGIIDQFTQADADANWELVDKLSVSFRHSILSNPFLTQLTRCLSRFDFNRLVNASNNICQTILAMQFADSLELEDRLRLAIATESSWVQFACIYEAIPNWRKLDAIGPSESHLLTTLLLKIAQDELQWRKWMAVFNRYPVRYPALQKSLGKALVSAPESAIQTYVDSIKLYGGRSECRTIIAACLQEFRYSASEERRKLLWSSAYHRWSEWNFDAANSERYLFEISWCELDYAVVGYIVECLNAEERVTVEQEIIRELGAIDYHWHATLSECISSWNRQLSRLQPFGHATKSIEGSNDWLAEKLYTLSNIEKDQYLKIMFSVH